MWMARGTEEQTYWKSCLACSLPNQYQKICGYYGRNKLMDTKNDRRKDELKKRWSAMRG